MGLIIYGDLLALIVENSTHIIKNVPIKRFGTYFIRIFLRIQTLNLKKNTRMKSSSVFFSVLIAAAAGAAIGVAFAPDNGKSTRKKAKKAVNEYAKKAKEELETSSKSLSESANAALETVKSKTNEMVSYTKTKVNEAANYTKDKVNSVQAELEA